VGRRGEWRGEGGEAWGSMGAPSRLMPLPLLEDAEEGEGGRGEGGAREEDEGEGEGGGEGEDGRGQGAGDEAESAPLAIVAISAK